jgi:hypothetical protein
MATQPTQAPDRAPDDEIRDELIREAEAAESGSMRNLFDLRMIIGGLFIFYGVYLTIRGLIDSSAAVEQAAGVRINLWTGLFALALGGGFALWALLRPLTVEQIIEGQAEGVEDELDDRRPAH